MSKAAKPGDKNADPKKDDPKTDPKAQGKGADGKGKSQLEVKDVKMDGKGKLDVKEMKSPKGDNKASPRNDSEDRKPEKNIIHKIFIEAPPPEKEDRKHALENSGILDAYAHLLQEFCKYGLPKGNVFEFAAVSILKFERKLKAEKANKLHAQSAVEGIEKYKELYRNRSVDPGQKDRERSDTPQRGGKKDRSESPQRGKKDRERSPSPEKGKDGKDKKGDPKKDDKKDPKSDKKDDKSAKDDKNKKDDKNAKPDPKADPKAAAKTDAKGKEAPKVEEKKDDKKAKK